MLKLFLCSFLLSGAFGQTSTAIPIPLPIATESSSTGISTNDITLATIIASSTTSTVPDSDLFNTPTPTTAGQINSVTSSTQGTVTTTQKQGSGIVEVHTNNKTGDTTVSVKIFNWGWKDLFKLNLLGGSSSSTYHHSPRGSVGYLQDTSCPDGWLKFSESCYYVEAEMLPYDRAQDRCAAKNATLFVPNSMDEWDAIREHGPKGSFAWVGLVQFAKVPSKPMPLWQTTGGVDPMRLNWVWRPYSKRMDGWSELSECAAHYNPLVLFDKASFVYYYPCSFNYGSICERNSTILNLMAANPQATAGYF